MNDLPSRDALSERLFQIYTAANRDLLLAVQGWIAPQADALAGVFYRSLLEIEESHPFLNHQIVAERLHHSMSAWIVSLFRPDSEMSVREHMQRQQQVGDVHARINIPMRLVNYGIRLLKDQMARILRDSGLNDAQKYQGLVLVHNLLDFSSSLINESYIVQHIHNEADAQALKTHLMSFSVVVQLERLRASMFDWLSKAVAGVYAGGAERVVELASIYTTDFGLWAIYKADLLFSERPDFIAQFRKQLQAIDEDIQTLNGLQGSGAPVEIAKMVERMSEKIASAAWTLGDVASQALEMESARDPLTRLLSRRFLPSVMQSMVRSARTTATTFTVLSLDLDHFKLINDRYGHMVGDQALVLFGDLLLSNVRVTDYVFRMGGDEFLIILAGSSAQGGEVAARNLLAQLARQPLRLDDGGLLYLKISIGIVAYDGHPDYLRVLKNADEALYQAKSRGRDNFYIYTPGR